MMKIFEGISLDKRGIYDYKQVFFLDYKVQGCEWKARCQMYYKTKQNKRTKKENAKKNDEIDVVKIDRTNGKREIKKMERKEIYHYIQTKVKKKLLPQTKDITM